MAVLQAHAQSAGRGEGTVPLTRQEVKHIADLAKLGLSDKDISLFAEQLSAILEYAAILEQLDTSAISPTATVVPLRNIMRADEAGPSLTQNDALANAPRAADGYFQVRAILE